MGQDGAFDGLRRALSGQLLVPGDAAYDRARTVFNAMIDRRPAAIARCASAKDVAAALAFAREKGIAVAVRGGGHSVAGLGVCDDGILIDLAGMKTIEVDPGARRARAGGGVLWGEFDAATQAHALHTPGGRVTTTGIGGFTTGGGYGWTSSKHGLACDNLVRAQVVLANGDIVTASERQNEDLFWGIRGGGGNFGIVTEFVFGLHELGPIVHAGLAMWPIERARDVLRAWRDFADGAPNEVSTAAVMVTAPPEPFVPDHLKGRTVVGVAALYVGDCGRGPRAFEAITGLGPAVNLIQPMPYTAFQAMLDPMAPAGRRSYWRGEYMGALSDGAIDVFVEHGAELIAAGAPLSQAVFFRIGQGVTSVPDDATAFSHRDASYMFHPITFWERPADDERLIAASRSFAEAMRPYGSGGAYLNFTPEADRVRDAYGADKYRRLVALKDKYDPGNLFRMNQNIRPSQAR